MVWVKVRELIGWWGCVCCCVFSWMVLVCVVYLWFLRVVKMWEVVCVVCLVVFGLCCRRECVWWNLVFFLVCCMCWVLNCVVM